VVAERTDAITWKSLGNVDSVHLLEPGQLNTYDVLISDDVIFTQAALESFVAGPQTGRSVKGAATSAEVLEQAPAVELSKPAAKAPARKAAAKKAAPEVEVEAPTAGDGADADSADEEQS
jgi:large subunit ribosomal protein L4